jgi:thiamine-phosphate pyrophosphorylase
MTPKTKAIRGLYAVTPDTGDTAALLAKTESALSGGVTILQYRNKVASPALRRTQATSLLELCTEHSAVLLINDHVTLAAEIGAQGAHIGGEDGSLSAAREVLGPDRLIGVSCYRDLDRAQVAADGGADYIAFGGFYISTVKPGNTRAPVSLLTDARRFGLPVVAIGGITPDNAEPLIRAGADAVAVITALYAATDIEATARQFAGLFNKAEP